jgi:hypothetical protein
MLGSSIDGDYRPPVDDLPTHRRRRRSRCLQRRLDRVALRVESQVTQLLDAAYVGGDPPGGRPYGPASLRIALL